jgi:beta-glucuronidase
VVAAGLVAAAPAAAQLSAPAPTPLLPPAPPLAQPPPAPTAPATATAPTSAITDPTGPTGRYLLSGTWLFRRSGSALPTQTSTAGWQPIGMPYSWNATDFSMPSFVGEIGWYRRDFLLPSHAAGTTWIVRFESVNYTTEVYLNGHEIARHVGEFLPFDVALPARDLQQRGANRLVLRVDSHHDAASLPPYRISTSSGNPVGGWWNYAGILRDVYLRAVHVVDIPQALVTSSIPCPGCAAHVDFTVGVHDYGQRRERITLRAGLGSGVVDLGTATLAPGASATVHRRVTLSNPVLWSPASPHLYQVDISAFAAGRRLAQYQLQTGIREIQVVGGHLYLNFKPVHLRGVGIQEVSLDDGFAIDDARRAQIIAEAKALGATLIRSQYPLDPELETLADRAGILLWSEIPVFSTQESVLDTSSFRRKAVAMLAQNIMDNGSHASIGIWSIANELSSRPGPGQRDYIRQAAASAHALDPTRPVGMALAAYPSVLCQTASYADVQVLGFNDYFGWYPGPNGQIADEQLLSPYLDQARRCYPKQAILVTEFGAEANRDGPSDVRGTDEFQSSFVQYHLGVFATKPWLSGAVYWALEDFVVWPGWNGGNPLPDPPFFNKGLVTMTGTQKPAFAAVAQLFHATQQLG